MRVFLHELKKILRPVTLLILAVFAVLYSFVILDSSFGYLTRYHETSDMVRVAADLIELAGTSPQQAELDAAVETLRMRYNAELEAYFRANPLYAAAGVTGYESFWALSTKRSLSRVTQEWIDTYMQGQELSIYDGMGGIAIWDPDTDYSLTPEEQAIFADWSLVSSILPEIGLRQLSMFAGEYERIDLLRGMVQDWPMPTGGLERIIEIYDSSEIRNILPSWAVLSIRNVFPMLSIMIIGTLMILLAPVVTKDTMSGVTALQYSGKTGRKTLKIQLAAMMVAAFAVAVIQIAIVFGVFIHVGWRPFLGSGLNSFADPFTYHWFTGNYGQFMIIIAVMMLVTALAAAMLIFFFSKLCKNYITLLLAIVPLAAALIALCMFVFGATFAIISSGVRPLYSIIPIPYVEVYVCGLLLLIGVVMAGVLLKKQKRAEVV